MTFQRTSKGDNEPTKFVSWLEIGNVGHGISKFLETEVGKMKLGEN